MSFGKKVLFKHKCSRIRTFSTEVVGLTQFIIMFYLLNIYQYFIFLKNWEGYADRKRELSHTQLIEVVESKES